jgi:hypothetical protein
VAEQFLDAWRSGKAYDEAPPAAPTNAQREWKGRKPPTEPGPRTAIPQK